MNVALKAYTIKGCGRGLKRCAPEVMKAWRERPEE